MFQKNAMMGVGVLLIFIATILVSAVAAGVLIRTSGAIGQKAVEVEKVSRERLTTGIEVVSVTGYANVSVGTIDQIEMLIRLLPGSSPIDLADTYVSFTTDKVSDRLVLSNSTSWNDNCTFNNLGDDIEFCFEPMFGNTNSNLEEEELLYVRFKMNESNAVQPNDDVDLQLIPKVGQLTDIAIRIPSIKQFKVNLY